MALRSNKQLAQEYLKHLARTKSGNTLYIYSSDLAKFVDHLGPKHVSTAKLSDLYEFLDRPRQKVRGDSVAPATIKREVMELRSFYRYLVEVAEVCPRNVAAKLEYGKVENEEPHPVPDDTWKRLWFSQLTDDMRVALGLGYFCGLRREEITLLSARNFVDVPFPAIVDWKRKGKAKPPRFRWRRCIDLYEKHRKDLIGDPDLFVSALSRMRQQRADAVALLPWDEDKGERYATRTKYPRPQGVVDPIMFNKRLTKLCREMSLPHVAPHDLRHSFCTNLANIGVHSMTLAKLAGHADPRVTMRYYELGEDPLAKYIDDEDGDDTTDLRRGRW